MKKIKKIGIFVNDDVYSNNIAKELTEKLKNNGYLIDKNKYSLCIAIGGDGSFLRMVRKNDFNNRIYYLGINAGTLGFAQEIYPNEIDWLLEMLNTSNYKIENISVLETKVKIHDNVIKLNSLNEIVIRDKDLKTTYLDIFINNELLENFVGDGILVSTSFGSSAYNLGLGGSLVYNDLHTLQITPIAPINNRTYHTLKNSVIIPEERKIIINPKDESIDFIITADGENYSFSSVSEIEIYVRRSKIKCVRMSNYDYTKRINEKLIKWLNLIYIEKK